jgi:hypothetical protein
MKRIKFAILACALAAVSLTSSVAASSQRRVLDFTLVNSTKYTILELYVSPTNDDKWGEDVLGEDILKPGEELEISFSRGETTCMWDLKIVDEDKDEVEWEKFNLCEASEITLKYENGKATAIVK